MQQKLQVPGEFQVLLTEIVVYKSVLAQTVLHDIGYLLTLPNSKV